MIYSYTRCCFDSCRKDICIPILKSKNHYPVYCKVVLSHACFITIFKIPFNLSTSAVINNHYFILLHSSNISALFRVNPSRNKIYNTQFIRCSYQISLKTSALRMQKLSVYLNVLFTPISTIMFLTFATSICPKRSSIENVKSAKFLRSLNTNIVRDVISKTLITLWKLIQIFR